MRKDYSDFEEFDSEYKKDTKRRNKSLLINFLLIMISVSIIIVLATVIINLFYVSDSQSTYETEIRKDLESDKKNYELEEILVVNNSQNSRV